VERLATRGELGLAEFHAEVAELEWTEFLVYASEADVPQRDTLPRLGLNPTLVVLDFRYSVATFVKAWRGRSSSRGPSPEPIMSPSPERVLVYRDPESHLAVIRQATDDILFALKMTAENTSVAEAVRLSGCAEDSVADALERARRAGLVVG
jgi:hypothetical protein